MQEMIDKGIQNVSLYKDRRQHPTKLKSVFTIFCTQTLVNTKNIMICYQFQINLHSYRNS